MGLSLLIFLPFMVADGGRFLFYGDFNVQQVPFYRLAHDAIRAGEWGWNYRTDLGANFIGSYSFYLLGSPFFWLTIPFPSEWLQFMMGPLFILKFSCASLTGYIYIHRYTKNRESALIGAVMYAFSGFSIYNIFFNHFHEAIVLFPLLLAALDEYMANRRRGLFALAVAFCCLTNYYFFVGQVTFTLVYFFVRLLCKSWRISLRDFLLLALEAVLGLGLSCVLLVPSVLAVIQNSRTSNFINGWNALLYNRNQRYLHIIECFFFPPDLPARPNFTPDSESKWASLGAWLPLFSMSGVIGWLQLRRKHWLKKLLWVLFVMALVPGLNSAFQMMNSAYYARWFYTLTLIMSLATVLALENERTDWKRAITWTMVITLTISFTIGLMPRAETTDNKKVWNFGLEQYPTRFWSYTAISMLSLAALIYVFLFCRKNKKVFYRGLTLALSLITVFYSIFFVTLGKTQSDYTWDHLIPYSLNGGKDIDLPDLQESRSDFYESIDNAGMFWEIPTIQAFHSIVPGSVMEFYESIDVTRDVASRPDTDHYALRGLTSVHWLFDDDHDSTYFAGEESTDPAMPGWVYYGNANGFDIWENQYYIPMGFSYNYYVTRSEYNSRTESLREKTMLRAIVLEDEDCGDFVSMLQELPEDNRQFTEETYLQDCEDRAKTACSSFRYTSSGFTAEMNTVRESVLFFSVPYEPGWSAKVNGEEAKIYRVNVGFMAVKVPPGQKVSIEFTYRTPGLLTGFLITLISLLLWIAYLVLMRRMKNRAPAVRAVRGSFRAGNFGDYAKARNASFLRPGALVPHFRQPTVIPEEPSLPEEAEEILGEAPEAPEEIPEAPEETSLPTEGASRDEENPEIEEITPEPEEE
ncbi:MAG: YfhO family protein [Acutalibacter sp.]|nr:YfhO family protein [Acutalibacter sp.]